MSLCFWTVNLTRVSQFFSLPPQWGQNGQCGLELGISLPPCGVVDLTGVGYFPSLGHFDSDNTPLGKALVNSFLQRAGLAKNSRVLWHIFKWFIFLSTCLRRGYFSNIYCGNLVEFLEVYLRLFGGLPCGWVPLEFFILINFYWSLVALRYCVSF